MRFAKCLSLLLALVCVVSVVQAQTPQPLPFVEGSWTFVLLPDVQNYTKTPRSNESFVSQTRWIVDNAAARKIAFALTEGDITQDNKAEQWNNAKAALSLLDGKVPYAVSTGNHDYRGELISKHATLANKHFPAELVQKSAAYGGAYEKDKLDNAYYLFSAGGRDWLVVTLEYAPRDGAVAWAGTVLDKYPRRSAIICTHAYLFRDNTRFDSTRTDDQPKLPMGDMKTGLNDGEQLWQKLVSKHANVQFVFCGHVTGTGVGRLTSKGDAGNIVHQVMANYQMRPEGGEGYLRLVEFLPGGKTVQFRTYSALLKKYLTDPGQQFTLDLPPAP